MCFDRCFMWFDQFVAKLIIYDFVTFLERNYVE